MGLSCSSQKPNANTANDQRKSMPANYEQKQSFNLQKNNAQPPPETIQLNEVDLKLYYQCLTKDNEDQQIKMLLSLTVNESIVNKIRRPDIDVIIILDVSYSMRGDKLDNAKKAIICLLSVLGKNDRISIITFRGKAKVHLQWTQNCSTFQDTIIQSIVNIQAPQNDKQNKRDFEESVEKSIELLETSINSKVLSFMITDGEEYFTTDLDAVQSYIFRSSSPKQYSYYIFAYDSNNPNSILKQFSEFTNGFNVLVSDVQEFAQLFLFTFQQILQQYADSVKIQITTENNCVLKFTSYTDDHLLQFNNRKYEIRMKNILSGLVYYFPFTLQIKQQDYDKLNPESDLITISVIGNKNFRITHLELDSSLKVIKFQQTQKFKEQLVAQQHFLQEVLFQMQKSYKFFLSLQLNECLQNIEQLKNICAQNHEPQTISYALINSQINKAYTTIMFINKMYLQYNQNLEKLQSQEECIIAYKSVIHSFNILYNLYEYRQDLNFKDSYTYSQSVLLNEYNINLKQKTNQQYAKFHNEKNEDFAKDLNDSGDEDNYLYKATNIIV